MPAGARWGTIDSENEIEARAMGHGYTQLRIRRNRELVERHPRWKHVRPERLNLPLPPTAYERYDTAVIDAERHLRQAEQLYRSHERR